MRIVFIIMILSGCMLNIGFAQQWQTTVAVDSRIGYSSNTYLNPFLTEWDTAPESVYSLSSILGKTYWYKGRSSASVTAGLFYEPLFESQTDNWKGAMGLIDFNRRISSSVSVGLDGGASYLNGTFSRTLAWVQPKITWFASPFTLFRLKSGSNFRKYHNFPDNPDTRDRFDFYGLEFESWPSYRWQITAGFYGGLQSLPNIDEGFSTGVTAGYFFKNGAGIQLNAGLEQYQYEIITSTGGGFPPTGPTQSVETNVNRMTRLGVTGSIPLDERFSVFASAEGLFSELPSGSRSDVQVSGGIRFNFEPRIGKSKRSVSPEWIRNNNTQEVRVKYSGEGRLYLVGSFNDWKKPGIPLVEQDDNTYVAKLTLTVGAYEYRILRVQGDSENWLEFSNDTYTVSDGFDSENAMLLIE